MYELSAYAIEHMLWYILVTKYLLFLVSYFYVILFCYIFLVLIISRLLVSC